MIIESPDIRTPVAPLAELERGFIDAFVRARGHDPRQLCVLPESEREALLKDASIDASVRLAEIESRSHLVHEIHDHASPSR
jgi:hypothetical protein